MAMAAGDIIPERIDSITENGVSVAGRIVEEITDVTGEKRLIPGKRHRHAIAKSSFRVDPNDEESDIDEAAFTAAFEAEIEKVAPAAKVLAKITVAREVITDLKEKIQNKNDQIAALQTQNQQYHDSLNEAAAQITTLNDTVTTLNARIAELEAQINDAG